MTVLGQCSNVLDKVSTDTVKRNYASAFIIYITYIGIYKCIICTRLTNRMSHRSSQYPDYVKLFYFQISLNNDITFGIEYTQQ